MDIADYDYDTAKALMESKRYLYVIFMCHQVFEKMIKAYWSKVLEEPPLKIHTLSRLAQKTGLADQMTQEQKMFIADMQHMNIEARYPEDRLRLAQNLNEKVCEHILEETDKLRLWIREKL